MRALAVLCTMIAGALFAGLMAVYLSTEAKAQEPLCMPRQQMVAKLAQEFGETQIGAGFVSQTMVLEFYLSAKGTWTIIQSFPDGRSCAVSSGVGWKMRPRPEEREA